MEHKKARKHLYSLILYAILALVCLQGCGQNRKSSNHNELKHEISEQFSTSIKNSIVHLEISTYVYDQTRPWFRPDTLTQHGFGVAVGPDKILTTAANIANAALIKVKIIGYSKFVNATVKTVDYDANLSLLEIDQTELDHPFSPIMFEDIYQKTAVTFYRVNPDTDFMTARGYIDRAEVIQTALSFTSQLMFMVTDASDPVGRGALYCIGDKAVGISSFGDPDRKQAELIPSARINAFLESAESGEYRSFAEPGFNSLWLLDPYMRRKLSVPEDVEGGILVTAVHNMGTGSSMLEPMDVILAVNGKKLTSYGRFEDDVYGNISFEHLITSRLEGEKISFKLWRDGNEQEIEAVAESIVTDDMLIPYQLYDQRPEYIIHGGFVFQQLTRDYLTAWGKDWMGSVPPQLMDYYLKDSFNPTETRKEVVILSYVLPAQINLGYHQLRQLVVKSCNGMKINALSDILEARELNPDSAFDIIEFEQPNPTVVIPREGLDMHNQFIQQNYGVQKLVHFN